MKSWIEEYKKTSQSYKLEEKNLIHSFLAEDFHLNKIYSALLKEDVDSEKRTLDSTLKALKLSIDDLYSYFKGQNKAKNFDLRQKIYKIDEAIGKNRMDFKTKFENLLFEEEALEREINDFEEKFNSGNASNDDTGENCQEENLIVDKNVSVKINNNSTNCEKIEDYISHILNNANIVFDDFPIESITKIIQKIPYLELEMIKDKTKIIEHIVEKTLGGVHLTWQPRDHQEFLKLRAIHNTKINTFEFLNDLENTLPFIPRSELKNHIKSYNKFFQLFELKKLLITQYKDLKLDKENREKRELLDKLTDEKRPSTGIANSTNNNLKRNTEKEKLIKWKKQKLQEKKEKYEEQMRLEQEIKEKEKQKYIERVNKNKPLIDEYRKSIDISENDQFGQNAGSRTVNNSHLVGNSNNFTTNNTCNYTQIDLERIREKNEKLIEKKMMIVKSKSLNLIKKAENYTKYKLKKMVEMEKLPVKVTEPTEIHQIKQRKKHDFKNDQKREVSTMANNVLGRMTRAVPEWRKSLI